MILSFVFEDMIASETTYYVVAIVGWMVADSARWYFPVFFLEELRKTTERFKLG
jgi:hypothetical protein